MLGRVVIKEHATKRSGYTTTRSSFATKTDTPLATHRSRSPP